MAISSCTPEFVKSVYQLQSARTGEHEAGVEILQIFLNTNADADADSVGCGASPSCCVNSPPSRAGNPIVRDTQFCYVKSRFSPSPIRGASKAACNAPSFAACPVRIEGFDCSEGEAYSHLPALNNLPASVAYL